VKRALLLVLAPLVFASAVGAANDFLIVVGGPRAEQRIGPYRFLRELGAGRSYPSAIRSFGAPSSRGADSRAGASVCEVRWTKLALEMAFASQSPDPCSGEALAHAGWFDATLYGGRWRTEKGLRAGDGVEELRRLYPKATYSDRPPAPPTWTLVSVRGEVGVSPRLQAYVWDGRVTALHVPPQFASVARSSTP
jgi:hypothetical protein